MTAITYPITLPGPADIAVQDADRRALAGMDGAAPGSARALERDRRATAQLRFRFTAEQWAGWHVWWRLALGDGGAWFSAPNWAAPWGTGVVAQFTGPVEVAHAGRGLRDVSVQAELRGASEAPAHVDSMQAITYAAISDAQYDANASAAQGAPASVFELEDGYWYSPADQDAALLPVGAPLDVAAVIEPVRGSLLAGAIQFRGAADTSNALGRLGVLINTANNTAAGALLAVGSAHRRSLLTGADRAGAVTTVVWDDVIETVYIGQLGMSGTYTVNDTGPCSAASSEFARLTFLASEGVRAIVITEHPATNYAGTPGTGSARLVSVVGGNLEGSAAL